MNCRDAWPGEDAASFRRVAPTPSVPTGAAPTPARPILAPPQREARVTPAPAYLRAGNDAQQRASSVPATPSPAIAERTAKEAATVDVQPVATSASVATTTSPAETVAAKSKQVREPATAPATTPAPIAVSAEAEPTTPASAVTLPTPQPSDTPIATASPDAVAPTVAISAAKKVSPTIVVATSPPPPPPAAVGLLDGNAFRALDSSHFTLELANAKSPQPLRELAARLQLSGAVYLVHLRSPESDRWLLTWADYASQAEARSARSMVPADAAINSGWPRRLAPLQNELVSP